MAGLASCTASLLAEGTNHYSGADIAARLEYAGAWTGTSVSTHHTSITLSSLNDKFAELLPLLIDIVFHPIFPAEATSGILRRRAAGSTSNAARCHFSQTKPYGHWPMAQVPPSPALNLQNRSSSLTPDQLREFHYSRLSSNDIHVFLSGNITPRIEALVTDTFSRIASGTSFGMSSLSFAPPAESPREVLVELPGSQQSAVNMMIPAPGRLTAVSCHCAAPSQPLADILEAA